VKAVFAGGIGNVARLILDWSPLGLFYRAFSGVMKWFGVDLPKSFSEFGANLIGGLVDGIKAKASAAKDAVVNLGGDIKGWFAEKLGIHSPSVVFAGFGGNIAEGAAQGILRALPGVQGAAGRLAGAALAGYMATSQAFAGIEPPRWDAPRPVQTALATMPPVAMPRIEPPAWVMPPVVMPRIEPLAQAMPPVAMPPVAMPRIEPPAQVMPPVVMPRARSPQLDIPPMVPPPTEPALSRPGRDAPPGGGITVHFSPTVTVQAGGNSAGIKEQVSDALKLSLHDLERMLDRIVAQKTRSAY
jgi:hypothetical protein